VSYYDRDAKAKDGEQTPVYAMSFELYAERRLAGAGARLQ